LAYHRARKEKEKWEAEERTAMLQAEAARALQEAEATEATGNAADES
jgi:DNA-directed RNA polymerase subunit beta'